MWRLLTHSDAEDKGPHVYEGKVALTNVDELKSLPPPFNSVSQPLVAVRTLALAYAEGLEAGDAYIKGFLASSTSKPDCLVQLSEQIQGFMSESLSNGSWQHSLSRSVKAIVRPEDQTFAAWKEPIEPSTDTLPSLSTSSSTESAATPQLTRRPRPTVEYEVMVGPDGNLEVQFTRSGDSPEGADLATGEPDEGVSPANDMTIEATDDEDDDDEFEEPPPESRWAARMRTYSARKAAVEDGVPIVYPDRSFSGHRNRDTVRRLFI